MAVGAFQRAIRVEVTVVGAMSPGTPCALRFVPATGLSVVEFLAIMTADCLLDLGSCSESLVLHVDCLRRLLFLGQDYGCSRFLFPVDASKDSAC